MKSPQNLVLAVALVLSESGLAQHPASVSNSVGAMQLSDIGNLAEQQPSPAEQRIAAAMQQLKADPKKVQAYNELATAFIRRARETANPTYLKEADGALNQGLKLDPEDFQLQKTQVSLFLNSHKFAQARDRAKVLNHRTPDDVLTYGYIAEADIALGDYADAETNAQWMMNLRPNNTPALLVGARLRVLFGDNRGAIDFLDRAAAQTSPVEVEDQAWIANQVASILIDSGQADSAEQVLKQSAQTFPDYPYTLENLARVRIAQKRAGDAVQLLLQATALDHDPHQLYMLASAQQAAGQINEAQATLEQFGKLADDPARATDASLCDLILNEAGNPLTASHALQLALTQVQIRRDMWTLDAYAWALLANGKPQEADIAIKEAMEVGIQSAQIFDHAGNIAQRLNRSEDAAKFFKLTVQSNPESRFADDALKSASIARELIIPQQGPDSNALAHSLFLHQDPEALQYATASANGMTTSARPRMTNPATAFAPVPDRLLFPEPTETSRLIQKAQLGLAHNPKDAAGYAGLGAAYFQHARETGDVSDYQMAEEALTKSLDLDSSDFSAADALAAMAEVCMGEHRFTDALSFAQKALSLGTGDISPFAIIGDAHADMGDYEKAANAYTKLTPRDMTLSPRAAYARDSRLAYLRFIAGNTPGAIELMKTSVAEGVEAQLPRENLAWLYYELGEFETQAGDSVSADAAYLAALNTHPGDYRALAALGKLRANNGRYAEAIVLYQKAIAVVPMPTFIAELGDLFELQGNHEEAQKQFALVEYIGLLGHINQVLHNRDLALFYADHDTKLSEAIELAQKELEVRRDIYSWDVLAWALYKNGKLTEASKASEKAMQFGTRDSLVLFHAGMIADRLGQRDKAFSDLKEALDINPHFHLVYAKIANEKVATLETQLQAKGGFNEIAR